MPIRIVLIFALGIACVLLRGFLLGSGRRKLSDAQSTDRDLERARTVQYHVRDNARNTGDG